MYKAKDSTQNGGVLWTCLFSFLSSPFSIIDFDHVPPEFSSLQAARASVQGLFSPTVAPPLIISSWVLGSWLAQIHLSPASQCNGYLGEGMKLPLMAANAKASPVLFAPLPLLAAHSVRLASPGEHHRPSLELVWLLWIVTNLMLFNWRGLWCVCMCVCTRVCVCVNSNLW